MQSGDVMSAGLPFNATHAVKWLCGILLVVLLARAGVFMAVYSTDPGAHVAQDSNTYLQLADALLTQRAFVSDGAPQLDRTPGYPLFIAALAVLGLDRLGTVWVQILLSVATFVPLYWLGSRLWNRRVGLFAAVILALDYTSFYASQMLLTESLYTFFLMLGLGFGAASLLPGERHYRLNFFLFGLFLAVATLIRPVSYYLLFAIVVGVIVVEWRRAMPWPEIFRHVLLFMLPCLLLVGGWQYRNYLAAGTSELSLIKGINLMRYRGADIIAQRDGLSLLEAREKFKNEIAGHAELSLVERHERYVEKAADLINQHPGLAIKGQIKGIVRLLTVPGEGDVLRYLGTSSPQAGAFGDFRRLSLGDYAQKWLVANPAAFAAFILALGYLIIVYLGAGVGMTKGVRGPHVAAHLLLIGTLLYFVMVSSGPYAYPRLRVPIMPILALYCAAGWCYLKNTAQAQRQ